MLRQANASQQPAILELEMQLKQVVAPALDRSADGVTTIL
jgi:hypothetical protein